MYTSVVKERISKETNPGINSFFEERKKERIPLFLNE